MAVIDVLIGARLLSQTVPGIVLNRIYRERELRRSIYVALPEPTQRRGGTMRHICIEPDASLYFLIQETWQDFFHIEVYRTNLMERRFKQKMQGYAAYAASPQHQQLFHTPALSVAVLAATDQMARTLKRWTEEVLEQVKQPELGERFFFTSMNISETSPIEMYLSPVWEQAFGTAQTPLLQLE